MAETKTIDAEELAGYFQEFAANFNDRADYQADLGLMQNDLEEYHAGWFANEHSPSGSTWPPLSPNTKKRVGIEGPDKILVDTGKLRASLTGRSSDSIREIVSEGLNHGLSFGTSVEYSIYHQTGVPENNLPQREHIGINDEILDDFAERIADRTVAIVIGARE